MINGNMAVGVSGDELMVRVGKDAHDAAVALPGARRFDMAARPMRGWISIAENGFAADEAFDAWVDREITFPESLPHTPYWDRGIEQAAETIAWGLMDRPIVIKLGDTITQDLAAAFRVLTGVDPLNEE